MKTPALDQLAHEGVRFAKHNSSLLADQTLEFLDSCPRADPFSCRSGSRLVTLHLSQVPNTRIFWRGSISPSPSSLGNFPCATLCRSDGVGAIAIYSRTVSKHAPQLSPSGSGCRCGSRARSNGAVTTGSGGQYAYYLHLRRWVVFCVNCGRNWKDFTVRPTINLGALIRRLGSRIDEGDRLFGNESGDADP